VVAYPLGARAFDEGEFRGTVHLVRQESGTRIHDELGQEPSDSGAFMYTQKSKMANQLLVILVLTKTSHKKKALSA
jgi:hypothetical protein